MTDARTPRSNATADCPPPVEWSVYLVRCGNGALYTGIATDVTRRFAEHARDGVRGAKYLRGKGPLRLVYVRAVGPKRLALRVESRIKRLRKMQKESLVRKRLPLDRLIALTRVGSS